MLRETRVQQPKVCILLKKGTKIHSDLDGINQIEFEDSADETVISLETELKETRLL